MKNIVIKYNEESILFLNKKNISHKIVAINDINNTNSVFNGISIFFQNEKFLNKMLKKLK
jgi:hypothetical protein